MPDMTGRERLQPTKEKEMIGCPHITGGWCLACVENVNEKAKVKTAVAASWEEEFNKANATIAELRAKLMEAEKFKTYVHGYLDSMNVPVDPFPEETAAHGCRISGRLK